MQILNRKKGDEFIQVVIEKLWSDIKGIQIGLTPEGDYITLDGKFVQDPKLFNIESMSPEERRQAQGWWRRKQNEDEAELKQEAKPEKQEARPEKSSDAATVSDALVEMRKNQEEFFARLTGLLSSAFTSPLQAVPNLKAVYTRQKGESINCTAPKNWDEFGFEEKPDWWGVEAVRIELGEDGITYTYKRFLVSDDQGGDKRGD